MSAVCAAGLAGMNYVIARRGESCAASQCDYYLSILSSANLLHTLEDLYVSFTFVKDPRRMKYGTLSQG